MVNFMQSPTAEEAKEDNQKGLQSFSDIKKPQNNHPSEFNFSDSEDSSLAYVDSLLNFDFIGDLTELGLESFTSMASLTNGDNAVFEECFDLGCDGLTGRTDVMVDGIAEEVGKTEAFGVTEHEKGVDDCGELLRDAVELIADEDGNLDDFGYLIEEEMGKVTLDSVSSCLVPDTVDESREGCDVDGGNVIEVAVGSPPSESGEETSSSSSGSSSSSEDESSDEEEEDKMEVKGASGSEKEIIDVEGEMEEGEIIASDIDERVAWSGDEDEGGIIASKNELTVLPPVPPVKVTLEPHHQPLPVGVVLSIVGAQIIVEGVEKHNPLDEGSILWITETRSPLGMVDETFGPVKNPYYIIRHNSESEVPSGLKIGDSVSFVPEFVNHILHDKSLYAKAYDASGANDEETSEEEFSDDEKEAEYKRMLKMKKRGKNHENVENKKTERKEPKTNSGNRKRDQAPAQNAGQGNQVRENHQDSIPSPVVPPRMFSGNNNQRSSSIGHDSNVPKQNAGQGNQGRENDRDSIPSPVVPTRMYLGNNGQHSSSIGHDSNVRPTFTPPFSPFRQNSGFPLQSHQNMGAPQNPGFTMQSVGANGSPFRPPQSMDVAQNPGFSMQSSGANGSPFQPPQRMVVAQNPGFNMQSAVPNGMPSQPPPSMGVAQNPGFAMQSTGANGMPQNTGAAQNLGFPMQSPVPNGMPFQPPQSMSNQNSVPFQAPQSMGVPQNPGFTMQSAEANGIPQSMNASQNPGFTMQSNGANGVSFQPPQSMGVDGFSNNTTLPWFGQMNPQMVYQMILKNGLAALEQMGMNPTSLPQNPVFPTMQPGFGQNMFDPSVLAGMLTALGQQLPFPFNAGQQAIPPNLQQMCQNSSINTNLATASQPQMSVTSSQGPYQNLSNPSQMGQQVFANNLQVAGTSHGLNQGLCQNAFHPTSQSGMAAAPSQHQQQQQQNPFPSAIVKMDFDSSMKPNTAPYGRPDTSPSSNQGHGRGRPDTPSGSNHGRGGGRKPYHNRRGGGHFRGGRGRQ